MRIRAFRYPTISSFNFQLLQTTVYCSLWNGNLILISFWFDFDRFLLIELFSSTHRIPQKTNCTWPLWLNSQAVIRSSTASLYERNNSTWSIFTVSTDETFFRHAHVHAFSFSTQIVSSADQHSAQVFLLLSLLLIHLHLSFGYNHSSSSPLSLRCCPI